MGGMTAAPVTTTEAPDAVGEASPRPLDAAELRGEAAVEAYARDHEGLTGENERDALDHLLAPKPARLYDVKVQYDTEDGLLPLVFVIRGVDGRKLDRIEQECVSDVTGRMDSMTADLRIVAEEGCAWLETARRSLRLESEEFRTMRRAKPDGEAGEMETFVHASPVEALEARFKTQLGLISGVAQRVRRISGFDAERVGQANRRLVAASGNS
jgi:hypothetical protein